MTILAVAGQVIEVTPIDGADRIVAARVDCGKAGAWRGVVGKDMQEGHAVTVFLQDAILPADDRWAFMEKHQWRVRMARFKGVPSECLILGAVTDDPVGTDLTERLGVTKYVKSLPASMQGEAVGPFPAFIPKTDEPNWQTVPEMVAKTGEGAWYVTEKADGTSCTVWNDGTMHVCSRNYELREFNEKGAGNTYWQAARKYGMDRIPSQYALQFEIVGPGIQSNPMGLAEVEVRAFSLYDFSRHRYAPAIALRGLCDDLGIPMAWFVDHGTQLLTERDIRAMADRKYPNGKPAEGVVIRCVDSRWSFKAINLAYKDAA